jgi:hypothetical protein
MTILHFEETEYSLYMVFSCRNEEDFNLAYMLFQSHIAASFSILIEECVYYFGKNKIGFLFEYGSGKISVGEFIDAKEIR